MITLILSHEDRPDSLDVMRGSDRIGEVTHMGEDGWAAYRANWQGRIVDRRIGTYASVHAAVSAIIDSVAESAEMLPPSENV